MLNKKEKYTIIMFTMSRFSEWEKGIRNRNYFILQELLKRDEVEKVIAVEYIPVTWRQKIKQLIQKSKIKNQNLFQNKKLQITNYKLFKNYKLKTKNLILWSYFPLDIDHFEQINAKIKIFDTVDNWAHHPAYKNKKALLKRNYQAIAKKADLIFTVSEDLKRNLFDNQENVFYIPNGVNAASIKNHLPANRLEPQGDWQAGKSKIKNANQKSKIIIGYVGTIQSRVDFDLVRYIAQHHKDKQFIFVGPVWKDATVSKVKDLENIKFVGRVAYNKIAQYLSQFSVGIIPHKINAFTRSMDPMKYYEYCAASLPVVSTKEHQTKEEFSKAIDKAIKKDSNHLRQKRQNFAKKNSWQSRVEEMMRILNLFFV